MFNFEGHDVRVVYRDGQPWFVAIDACRCIGLMKGGKNLDVLNKSEWITLVKSECDPISLALFTGCVGRITLISESGLYKLIMRSDKPAARRFQDWVTREVLPALRKDGLYVVGEEKVRTGEMSEDELILKAMTLLQKKAERLAYERNHAHAIIQEHLLMLPIQVWQGINECYLDRSEAGQLAYHASCMGREEGMYVMGEEKVKSGEMSEMRQNAFWRR